MSAIKQCKLTCARRVRGWAGGRAYPDRRRDEEAGNEEPSWSQAARAKCSGWQRVFSLAPCYRKLSSQNEADSAQRPINASSVLSKRGGPRSPNEADSPSIQQRPILCKLRALQTRVEAACALQTRRRECVFFSFLTLGRSTAAKTQSSRRGEAAQARRRRCDWPRVFLRPSARAAHCFCSAACLLRFGQESRCVSFLVSVCRSAEPYKTTLVC